MTRGKMKFFEHARNVAKMSTFPRVHVGAVIVYGSKILACGFDQTKTHPLQARFNAMRHFENQDNVQHSIHAEMAALSSIWDADLDWSKVEVFVYRLRGDRPHGYARPCKACMTAIREKGIRDVYYTGDDGFIYERLDELKEVV